MKEIKRKFKAYYDEKNFSLNLDHFIFFEMALMMVVHLKKDADPNKGYIVFTKYQNIGKWEHTQDSYIIQNASVCLKKFRSEKVWKDTLKEYKKDEYAGIRLFHIHDDKIIEKETSNLAYANRKDDYMRYINSYSSTRSGKYATQGIYKYYNKNNECLCRCSSLYFCLNTSEIWEKFYKPHRTAKNPIHNDDIIYTPDVIVFKTDTAYPQRMDECDWYQTNVITCAAPNLRERPGNLFNTGDGNIAVKISDEELQMIHEKRFRRILDVAVTKGNEVVILGAFGCGAFANNPEVVARAAKNVVKEYKYAFQEIEFAVYCTPRDERNYKVFSNIILE